MAETTLGQMPNSYVRNRAYPQNTVIHDGKRVLDAARAAGVFSVAWWVARKPG